MVGDGSYLMMAQEIVTAVQEGIKMTIVLLDNHGFASIGGLSEAVGSGGFGTRYRYRNAATGELDGEVLPVDLAANAASLGAQAIRADTRAELARRARRDREGRAATVGHRRAGRSRGARRRLRVLVGRAGRRGVDDPRGPGGARGVGRWRGRRSATSCDSCRQRALLLGRARVRSAGRARAGRAGAGRDGRRRLRRHRAGRLGIPADRAGRARRRRAAPRARAGRRVRAGRAGAEGRARRGASSGRCARRGCWRPSTRKKEYDARKGVDPRFRRDRVVRRQHLRARTAPRAPGGSAQRTA